MPAFQDISGKRYGRLMVIERNGTSANKKSTWLCQCDCGNMTIVMVDKLKSGHTKSCGCIAKETAVINGRKNSGDKHRIHGMSRHPLDAVFDQMKQRCMNPNHPRFFDYGGRGIDICQEWLVNRKSFYDWALSNGYQRGLSIDRIDNDCGYYPDNCRFITTLAQNNNTRKNRFYVINGQRKSISEWARVSGLAMSCVYERLERGLSIEEALIPGDKSTHISNRAYS